MVCVTFNRKALLRNKRNQRKRKQKVKRKRNIRNTRNMGVRNTNISVQNTRNTKTRTSHLGLVVTYALTHKLLLTPGDKDKSPGVSSNLRVNAALKEKFSIEYRK